MPYCVIVESSNGYFTTSRIADRVVTKCKAFGDLKLAIPYCEGCKSAACVHSNSTVFATLHVVYSYAGIINKLRPTHLRASTMKFAITALAVLLAVSYTAGTPHKH